MKPLRNLVLSAVLSVCLVPPAGAVSSQERADIETFVLGNAVFTVFHEIGHALIDQLQLPLLGKEEDAVDGLATLLMLGDRDDPKSDELIFAAADGWALMHAQTRKSGEKLPFWDTHSLDMQRFHNIVCMIYGSDPDGFGDVVSLTELPDERRELCSEEYEKAAASWAEVLAPHKKKFGGGITGKIKVEYDVPRSGASIKARAFLQRHRLGKSVAEMISRQIALPETLLLGFRTCELPNAHYDPEAAEVVVCYELISEFREMIEAEIKGN